MLLLLSLCGGGSYRFVEVVASNQGVHWASLLFQIDPHVLCDRIWAKSMKQATEIRVVGWLRRLHEQWLAAQQGEASGESSGVGS
jgi:hypothetical protein